MNDSLFALPPTTSLDRRDFLWQASAAAAPFLAMAGPSLPLRADEGSNGGKDKNGAAKLIVREKNPDNLEFPFHTLDSFFTPNDLFYVRNHFPTPKIDARDWSLKVEGAVERKLTLNYDSLVRMASRKQIATLECCGNSRGLLSPKVGGVQWISGAVSNAEWTGVPLAAILDRAGLKDSAVDVVLEGTDKGDVKVPAKPRGEIHFARSLPLAKARKPEVLLAHHMNGKPLPALHGFPLRAVVPGWYGVASIKWLKRIVVLDRPFQGFFQTMDYTYWQRVHGLPTLTQLTEMQVRSEIARPASGEKIPASKDYRIFGAAWGPAGVRRVEVSVDGGKTWSRAVLRGESMPFAWRFWDYTWREPAAGKYTLMARARDKHSVQPMERDTDRRNYMVSHVLPVSVTVA
jgi:DMSO/TMAO reductase YedYZ molybdopterin-dependent catalytic subunit